MIRGKGVWWDQALCKKQHWGSGGLQVIWDVATGKSLCGTPASAAAVAFLNDPAHLATCGRDSSLNLWHIDRTNRKLVRMNVLLGSFRRDFTCLTITADDKFMYVGSTSGDVAEVLGTRPCSNECSIEKQPGSKDGPCTIMLCRSAYGVYGFAGPAQQLRRDLA